MWKRRCGRGWAGNTSVSWLVNRGWRAATPPVCSEYRSEHSCAVMLHKHLKTRFLWFTQRISRVQICGKEQRILRMCTWRTHGYQPDSSFFTIGATLFTENESVSSVSLSEDLCPRPAVLWADISLLLLAVALSVLFIEFKMDRLCCRSKFTFGINTTFRIWI